MSTTPTRENPNPPQPPFWLMMAMDDLQTEFPNAALALRHKPVSNTPADLDWRVKCLDCPGKLYQIGPAQTLNNFRVHLRNRQHVGMIATRLSMDELRVESDAPLFPGVGGAGGGGGAPSER